MPLRQELTYHNSEDLNVDLIQEVSWNKDAFNHLVADPETKELVQALVSNKVAAERGTDLMQNKGNGLIMLLHGGPGTGKTFTAESVAEIAEKPLYPVTCGDIGTKPEDVEKYLESVFHLGKNLGMRSPFRRGRGILRAAFSERLGAQCPRLSLPPRVGILRRASSC